MGHLSILNINHLSCSKSWVANELLDALTCYDCAEYGVDKLIFNQFDISCEPFLDEVISRLVNMCPQVSHLQLSEMHNLSDEGRNSMLKLLL